MKKPSHYDSAIEVLRAISILAVVLIHTTTRSLESSGLDVTAHPTTLFLNQVSRFAVPLFFMISGFVVELSYSSKSSYLKFIQKRIGKILIPYIFWSAVYYFLIYRLHTMDFFPTVITGLASYQLYFIPALFVCYLLYPLLRIFRNTFLLVVVGLFQIYVLYQEYFIRPIHLPDPIRYMVLNLFVFVAGIWAAHYQEEIIRSVRRWWWGGVAAVVVGGWYIFQEGLSRYVATGNYLAFYSQWRPSVMVYAVVVGWVLYGALSITKFGNKVTRRISGLSFFVFFFHVIALETVWSYGGRQLFSILPRTFPEIIAELIFFIIVAGLSLGVGWTIHRGKHLAKITG